MREFTEEELAKYNGEKGNPVYICYNGKVYDVSRSSLWKTGIHQNRHKAGTDLTYSFFEAPHSKEVFERYPQVGILVRKTESSR